MFSRFSPLAFIIGPAVINTHTYHVQHCRNDCPPPPAIAFIWPRFPPEPFQSSQFTNSLLFSNRRPIAIKNPPRSCSLLCTRPISPLGNFSSRSSFSFRVETIFVPSSTFHLTFALGIERCKESHASPNPVLWREVACGQFKRADVVGRVSRCRQGAGPR